MRLDMPLQQVKTMTPREKSDLIAIALDDYYEHGGGGIEDETGMQAALVAFLRARVQQTGTPVMNLESLAKEMETA